MSAVDTLQAHVATLPEGHHEIPGLRRAIEILTYAEPGTPQVDDHVTVGQADTVWSVDTVTGDRTYVVRVTDARGGFIRRHYPTDSLVVIGRHTTRGSAHDTPQNCPDCGCFREVTPTKPTCAAVTQRAGRVVDCDERPVHVVEALDGSAREFCREHTGMAVDAGARIVGSR